MISFPSFSRLTCFFELLGEIALLCQALPVMNRAYRDICDSCAQKGDQCLIYEYEFHMGSSKVQFGRSIAPFETDLNLSSWGFECFLKKILMWA